MGNRVGRRAGAQPVALVLASLLAGGTAPSALGSPGPPQDHASPARFATAAPSPRLSVVVPGQSAITSFADASDDGSHVLLTSSTNLIPESPSSYVGLYDVMAGRILRVGGPNGHVAFEKATPDSSSVLFTTSESLLPEDGDSAYDLYLASGNETRLVSPGTLDSNMKTMFLADDASVAVFSTAEPVVPEDTDNAIDLYRWDAATGMVSLVTPGVPVDTSFAGATVDGGRVFVHVMEDFANVGTIDNLYVSTPTGLVRFGTGGVRAISSDGARVYFDSEHAFVPEDTDALSDGYEWGPAGYRLLSDPGVGWVSVRAVNDAGTSWIIEAQDRLAPDDTDATIDLYLGGEQPSLLTRGDADAYLMAATRDLSVIVYETASGIAPSDDDLSPDLYRALSADPDQVDLVTGSMGVLHGGRPVLEAMSPDGASVIVSTAEAIDEGDIDGVVDVYRWTATGHSILSPGGSKPVAFNGASLDTNRVFFRSQDQLVPADVNRLYDVYVSDVDTSPPTPTIDGPASPSEATVTFAIGSIGDDVVWFDCRLDGDPWQQCGETLTLAELAPGPHVLAVHGYDAAANRSLEPTLFSWTVAGGAADLVPPSGAPLIADGDPFTKTAQVLISTAATDDASGVVEMKISNDGVVWTVLPYASTQAWTLAPGGGTRSVYVSWKDGAANWSGVVSDDILVDLSAPVVSGLSWTPPSAGAALTGGRVPIRVAWIGSDTHSGIDRYAFSLSTDGGAFAVIVPSTTATSLVRNLAPGHAYRFAVQAVDRAGNVGAWAYSPTYRLTGISQSSGAVRYAGTWATSTSTIWWGGTARSSSRAGSTATYTFTGRSIAWVGLKGVGRGKANVYVNGVYKATVDLYSATTKKQLIVWSANYATSATRTVTIKVLGTSGRPRVDVDGFIVGS